MVHFSSTLFDYWIAVTSVAKIMLIYKQFLWAAVFSIVNEFAVMALHFVDDSTNLVRPQAIPLI